MLTNKFLNLNGATCIRCLRRKVHHNYRVLSGIQPTGSIHLGNYFGAIKQWVDLQMPRDLPALINTKTLDDKTNKSFSPKYLPPIFQIADLHSLTLSHDSDKLRQYTIEIAAVLLGCGLDPDKCILFKQSSVPYHGYLCWIITTLTTLPQLHRFPQFKDKSLNFKEPPTGLFLYPILQAADILLYKGTHIPIGDDQLAHINLTKHLTSRFNHIFKNDLFPIPMELILKDGGSKIKSLRAPKQKMSKSELDTKARIDLLDSSDEIIRKIRKSVTDMKSEVTFNPEERPGVSNLVQIYSLISGLNVTEVCAHFTNKNTFDFKIELGELLAEYLKPITNRINEYQSNPDYLEQILKNGSEKANEIAEKTILEVKQTIGLV